MKNILLFTLLSLMFLLGTKETNAALPVEEAVRVESVLQADIPADKGDAYVDTESWTGQWRISGRGQRTLSVQHISLGKASAYQAAKKRLEILSHSILRVYSSLPCQSWALPSDRYVFGLRRILI